MNPRHRKPEKPLHFSHERMGRLLGHGELRFVLLYLLNEKPRHGYDLIKALEELSSGVYAPSSGVIYPTLNSLEEASLALASLDDNKKLYTITKSGKELLSEHEEEVDVIIFRMKKMGQKISKLRKMIDMPDENEKRSSIRRSMHEFKSELFYFVDATPETKQKIVDIIDKMTAELKKLREN